MINFQYDGEIAKKPGAIKIDEVLLGTKLACGAITDDEEGTLEKVGKMNPWHIEALKMITGSREEAHKPLTYILEKYFDLKCDKILNLSGWSGGKPIDTQGKLTFLRCSLARVNLLSLFSLQQCLILFITKYIVSFSLNIQGISLITMRWW